MSAYRSALVVIGAGGLGLAIARRLGPGQRVVLADYSQKALDTAAESLREHGHEVETRIVDVSSYESVTKLAKFTAATGPLNTVVNAAGISPNMGTAKRSMKSIYWEPPMSSTFLSKSWLQALRS